MEAAKPKFALLTNPPEVVTLPNSPYYFSLLD
jgi:hypothetical protein